MFAVIETGGKQYLVEEGSEIVVEKLPQAEGETVAFKTVLLAGKGSKIALGQPYLKKVQVEGKVIKQFRLPKVWGVKFKPKKRYKRTFGHRQHATRVKIVKIVI
jgi:large subunit ribosomal protein L21